MNTETDKVTHDMMMYGSGFMKDGKHVPLNDIYKQPIELNQEHVDTWELCYNGTTGDEWLINLFANEYFYLHNGHPACGTLDFSC